MVTYLFILFAVIAIATALAVVFNKSTVNSALFLVLNLLSLAGIYLLLQAQFLAIIQVLVYAGAIMVLFLFVIMLLNLQDDEKIFSRSRIQFILSFLLVAVVFAQILYSVGSAANMLPAVATSMKTVGTVEAVGNVLFTRYLIPVEVTAILLTAAVVGALLIAQRKIQLKK